MKISTLFILAAVLTLTVIVAVNQLGSNLSSTFEDVANELAE